jgi:rare lipoprotein A
LVTDVRTERTVECRVNDRGPFVRGRIVDLSRSAAEQLGIIEQGLARVRIRVVRD